MHRSSCLLGYWPFIIEVAHNKCIPNSVEYDTFKMYHDTDTFSKYHDTWYFFYTFLFFLHELGLHIEV